MHISAMASLVSAVSLGVKRFFSVLWNMHTHTTKTAGVRDLSCGHCESGKLQLVRWVFARHNQGARLHRTQNLSHPPVLICMHSMTKLLHTVLIHG